MKRKLISVPFSVELTNVDNWEKLNKHNTAFFTIRLHFQLTKRILKSKHKIGDYIGLYQSPKGMNSQQIISEEIEIEQISSTKTIENVLKTSEKIEELALDIVNKIDIEQLINLKFEIKNNLTNKISQTFSLSREVSDSKKIKYNKKITITNNFPKKTKKAIVSVPVYRKRAFDLTLSYIDFLKVDYKRTTFGLRKKSIKTPPIVQGKFKNIIKLDIPLNTIYYWELIENSCKYMYEKNHKVEVHDPSEIIFESPKHDKGKFLEFPIPNQPSLYQIAQIVFPFKWIFLKNINHQNLSVEDLKKVELEEVKKSKNGWFAKHFNKALDDE